MGDTKLRGEGQVRATVETALLAQRGALIGWVPVCLAFGIGWYFSRPVEPSFSLFVFALPLAALLLAASRLMPAAYAPLAVGLMLAIAGASVAKWRTYDVAAPVLTFRYYGAIEGRVVKIDRSASDATRLTLDRVVLERMSPARTPERVRVSLHGDQPLWHFKPGEIVMTTGHLSPPAGPAEPGGFDFQRHAWFLQLGAVGYTRNPVVRLAASKENGFATGIVATRMHISRSVQQAMPGEEGAFAAAIMTGDRSAMGQETLRNLRAANLAHLLAISGLHMGLLTGFIFAAVRSILAVTPGIGLRWPTKKIAAVCALIVGAFYLALSGGNVATERAYLMVSVMFVAVLLDRRALTLRAVAMAAIVVLIWKPDALAGPGFQMSFAATTALVAVFGALRRMDLSAFPKWSRPVLSVVISSFIAGLATAPFAAAHFNQIAHYGLIANLLSVPLMGILVMPAAVLAVCLAPLGLGHLGLWFMELGLRWILFVAGETVQMEGAVGHVIAPGTLVLPILSFGMLWVILWQGRARWAGCAAIILCAVLWTGAERPAVLVADNGSLVGVASAQGRALSKPKGSGFVAGIWLENDGNPVAQAVAAERSGFERQGRVVTTMIGDWQITQVSGKTALAALDGCAGADILISNQTDQIERECLVFDVEALRKTGALALDLNKAGDLIVTTAHSIAGVRPWNQHQGSTTKPYHLRQNERIVSPQAAFRSRTVSEVTMDQ